MVSPEPVEGCFVVKSVLFYFSLGSIGNMTAQESDISLKITPYSPGFSQSFHLFRTRWRILFSLLEILPLIQWLIMGIKNHTDEKICFAIFFAIFRKFFGNKLNPCKISERCSQELKILTSWTDHSSHQSNTINFLPWWSILFRDRNHPGTFYTSRVRFGLERTVRWIVRFDFYPISSWKFITQFQWLAI